jgi:hypothetical protein
MLSRQRRTRQERDYFNKIMKLDDRALNQWFTGLGSAEGKRCWQTICWEIAKWVAGNLVWELVCKCVEAIPESDFVPPPEPPGPQEEEVEIIPLPPD